MTAPNTLGLDDDLDSVGLLVAVEHAFDIKIEDHEAGAIRTMGDIQEIVASKLDGAGGDKCRTSMAFYRVRRALEAALGNTDIRPDTPLRALWNGSPRSLFAKAQAHCDLRLAPLSGTNMSGIGALSIVAVLIGVPVLLIAKVDGLMILGFAAALIAAGIALIKLDPLTFGRDLLTVGDLAQKTARQNYGALVRLGGRTDPDAIWATLAEIASECSEQLPQEQIERSTVILQSQYDKAR